MTYSINESSSDSKEISAWEQLLRHHRKDIADGNTDRAPHLSLDKIEESIYECDIKRHLLALCDVGIFTIHVVDAEIVGHPYGYLTFLWNKDDRLTTKFEKFLEALAPNFTIYMTEFTIENFSTGGNRPKCPDDHWLFNVDVISRLSVEGKLVWCNLQWKEYSGVDMGDMLYPIVESARENGLGLGTPPPIQDHIDCHPDPQLSVVYTCAAKKNDGSDRGKTCLLKWNMHKTFDIQLPIRQLLYYPGAGQLLVVGVDDLRMLDARSSEELILTYCFKLKGLTNVDILPGTKDLPALIRAYSNVGGTLIWYDESDEIWIRCEMSMSHRR